MATIEHKGIGSPTATRKWPHFKTGDEKIRDSVVRILLTKIGQRFFVSDFGSGLHDLIFEQNTQITAVMAESMIRGALGRWEPRVTVSAVRAQRKDHHLILGVSYLILGFSLPVYLVLQITRDSGETGISVLRHQVGGGLNG